MPKNVGDLGKLIVAKGFKKLPKVKKIAQSGHTGPNNVNRSLSNFPSLMKHRPSLSMFEVRSTRPNETRRDVRRERFQASDKKGCFRQSPS